jgi:hypothetical protein
MVTTGDPVFLQLVDTLDVSIHYALSSAAGPLAARGTIGATATIEGLGGWTAPLASVAPVAFSGASAHLDVPLDLGRIPALEKAVTAETGVALDDPELVVTPVVHIHTTVAGTPVAGTMAPPLAFRVEGPILDVLGTSVGNGGTSPPMATAHTGAVERRIFIPARLSFVGRSLSVVGARRLGLGGLVLSLLALMATGIWRTRRRRMDETARIHAAYGHDLVAVSASPAAQAPLVVDVATFDELARLARRYDCVILEHSHRTGHAYYVESGTTLYRCGVEDADPVLVVVDGFLPPEPVPAVPAAAALPADGAVADKDTTSIADDVELLTLLAKAELVSGVGDATAHLGEAVVLARKAGLDGALVEALLVNARTAFDAHREADPERAELLDAALAWPGNATARRARLLGARAVESLGARDSAGRGSLLDEAVELARRSGDPRALVEVASDVFLARPRPGWSARRFAVDLPLFGPAVDAAVGLGDPLWVATIQSHAALASFIAGDGETLRTRTTALAETSAGGQNQIALHSQLLLGQTIALLDGHLADAEALSTEAADVQRPRDTAGRAGALARMALRREDDRLGELIPLLAPEATSPPPSATTAALAFALMETGQRDDAAILLHSAGRAGFGDIPDDLDWPLAVALWSEVAAGTGDRRAAAELHDILRPHDGIQMCAGAVGCGPAARLLALLEILLGRPAEADRHFAQALTFSHRLRSPVWVARCQLDWAQTRADRGERTEAARLTDEADAVAGTLALPALGRQWAALRDQLDQV